MSPASNDPNWIFRKLCANQTYVVSVKVHENITLNASTAVTLLESTFAEYDPMTQVHVDMRREGMSCYLVSE